MPLDLLLDRCRRLEERAAAIYRSYATAARTDPPLCTLWTTLAREEDAHAHALATAQTKLGPLVGRRTHLDGWEEDLHEVELCLCIAEALGPAATRSQQLSAALDLELTELEALRHVLLAVSNQADVDSTVDHAALLAKRAADLSADPHVRLQAALLLARARVRSPRSEE